MIQETVIGAKWGVAEGQMTSEDGDSQEGAIRVIVFIDPSSGKQYHYPMLKAEAVKMGRQASCEDLEAEMKLQEEERRVAADLTVIEGDGPPKEALDAMQAAGRGQDPGSLPIFKRPGKPVGG